MWSRMAKMPTFTTSCLCCLLCPTPCYSALLLPTSYHFSPHPTRFSSVVKRNRANVMKKVVKICEGLDAHFWPNRLWFVRPKSSRLSGGFRYRRNYSRGLKSRSASNREAHVTSRLDP